MLECYFDDDRHWPRVPDRRVVGCTAFVLPVEERMFCERRWRQQLLSHALPAFELEHWSELIKVRRWEMPQRSRILGDFLQVVQDHSVVTIYAVMDTLVWRSLDQRQRRVFKSAEAFCFLRVLRLLVDRLEAASETGPLQLLLAACEDSLVAGAEALAFGYAMDTRASARLMDVRFCDPRHCTYLQAVDFMSRRLRGQLAERRADAGGKPAWLKMLGPVNVTDETIGEYWDQEHCERYIASVDWDVPDQRRIGRRRS